MQEASEDVQPGVALQDLLPQVRRRRAVRIGRVPGVMVVAPVERQEDGVLARQLGGHLHLAVGHREMHQRPGPERQQRFPLGQPVVLVLQHRVGDVLGEVGLQLGRRHRDAVDEEHQVDAVAVLRRVVHLPHHPQPHRRVPLRGGLVQRGVGPELAHLELRVEVLEPAPQHRQRAAVGLRISPQRLHQRGQHTPLRLGQRLTCQVRLDPLGQLLGLRIGQPPEHILGEQRQLTVIAGIGRRVQPAIRGQVLADLGLERRLVMLLGHALRRPSHVDLAGHRIGDQRRPILMQSVDHLSRLGDERVNLRSLLAHLANNHCLNIKRGNDYWDCTDPGLEVWV